MHIHRIEDFTGGWVVGAFSPTLLSSSAIEVAHKRHTKGEDWPSHYHTATEINVMITGYMRANGCVFGPGDVFVVEPYEIIAPEFITDVDLIVIKYPSLPGDKYGATA